MKPDLSRSKSGPYAIIENTFKEREGYMVVGVLQRDEQGNVLRMKRNVLSERRTVADAQKLIDTWAEIDAQGLVEKFEQWKK